MEKDKQFDIIRVSPELFDLQRQFDEGFGRFVDAINKGESGRFRYDTPTGYAIEIYIEGVELFSIAYGDEDSVIEHDSAVPLICGVFWCDLKREEYDQMVFYGSHRKYPNDAARRASILETDEVIRSLQHFKAHVIKLD